MLGASVVIDKDREAATTLRGSRNERQRRPEISITIPMNIVSVVWFGLEPLTGRLDGKISASGSPRR